MTRSITQIITRDVTVGVVMTWALFVGTWLAGVSLLMLSLTL